MAKLERHKSGSCTNRKVIPQDISEAYGKQNEVKRWPASLSVREAQAEWRVWLDSIETRIEHLRQSQNGAPSRLPHCEVVALVGRWYKQRVQAHEEPPRRYLGGTRRLTICDRITLPVVRHRRVTCPQVHRANADIRLH
mgnify:CR=1 FL=1